MRVLKSLSATTTYPTGDKSFAVQQGFPQPISAEEADPFLMCDHFVRRYDLQLPCARSCAHKVLSHSLARRGRRAALTGAAGARMSFLSAGTRTAAWTS
jgi:hypothetical protein